MPPFPRRGSLTGQAKAIEHHLPAIATILFKRQIAVHPPREPIEVVHGHFIAYTIATSISAGTRTSQ
jgi:hypothetical protein